MERNTRQRQALLDALRQEARAVTAPELCALARRAVPRLNLSTVYRQLRDMAAAGDVLRVDLPGHPPRYEAPCVEVAAVGAHHHHHFHCVGCDQVHAVHGCTGAAEALAPSGWQVLGHDVTLRGYCGACVARGRSAS